MLRVGKGQGVRESPHSGKSHPDGARTLWGKWPTRARAYGMVRVLCWAYLGTVILIWLALRFAADRWWPATVLLYGPRWVYGVPALVLAPAVIRSRPKLLWALLLAGGLVVFPIMGFCIPSPLARKASSKSVFHLLSCNVDGENMDSAAMFRLIDSLQPDAIACQEWPPQGEALSPVLVRLGWHIRRERGIFFASRYPILSAVVIPTQENWRDLAAVYSLQTPSGVVYFMNVHLETARKGLESLLEGRQSEIQPMIDNIQRRRDESEMVSRAASEVPGPLIVAGDFNLPSDSAIFRDNWAKFDDAFAVAGWGFGYSKHTTYWGIRIDHVLVGPEWAVRSCQVQSDVGSDHLPLFTELAPRAGQ